MTRREVFARILKRLRPYAPRLVLIFAAALVTVAAQLLVPFFVGRAIDVILGAGNVDFSALGRYLAVIGGLVAVAALSQYALSVLNNAVAFGVLSDMRAECFSKLGRLPLKYLDSHAYGELSSVMLSDAEQFSDGLLLGFTQIFTGAATIVGVLVLMFVMRWEIALVVAVLTPLSLFAAKIIASRTYRMFTRQSELRAEQTAFIDENIGNLKVVKAYCRERENAEIFAEGNERLRACSLRAIFFSSTTNPVTRFVNSFVYAAVAFAGAMLAISTAGTALPFTVGNLTTFLSYATQYTKPFNEISEVIAEFQNALTCAGRIFALSESEEQPSDGGLPDLENVRGEVGLDGVTFSYDGKRDVLEDICVHAEPGQRIAIVGPTGCGKTTLINLLMRFYDADAGSVRVDGADVRDITRHSLREHFGMVLQETWLKEGTVRENLLLGAKNCSDEEMESAARAAHADGFIRRLPQGYDTPVGGEGSLSEGQRQLLCIARVMLLRPPMLILDEATSNIDTRTELLVQDAFARLMAGRTCFVVAHRLSTVRDADVILVMREGRIVERGTHDELLARGGFYSELYRAQFEG